MQYVSTRGTAPVLYFDDVLLAGLATDGGLYLPESWPTFSAADIRSMQRMKYTELAVRVMTPFLGEQINEAEFAAMVEDAFAGFAHVRSSGFAHVRWSDETGPGVVLLKDTLPNQHFYGKFKVHR